MGYSMSYLEGQLAVALGGRVAEELAFGEKEVTTGASNDLQQVRNIARRMVAQWGYSMNTLGATSWESPDGNSAMASGASPETEKAIDDEVRAIVDVAYKKCKETLESNWPLMEELTERLMEKENVDFVELYEMVGKYNPGMAEAAKKNMPPEVLANMTNFKDAADAEDVEMKVPEPA